MGTQKWLGSFILGLAVSSLVIACSPRPRKYRTAGQVVFPDEQGKPTGGPGSGAGQTGSIDNSLDVLIDSYHSSQTQNLEISENAEAFAQSIGSIDLVPVSTVKRSENYFRLKIKSSQPQSNVRGELSVDILSSQINTGQVIQIPNTLRDDGEDLNLYVFSAAEGSYILDFRTADNKNLVNIALIKGEATTKITTPEKLSENQAEHDEVMKSLEGFRNQPSELVIYKVQNFQKGFQLNMYDKQSVEQIIHFKGSIQKYEERGLLSSIANALNEASDNVSTQQEAGAQVVSLDDLHDKAIKRSQLIMYTSFSETNWHLVPFVMQNRIYTEISKDVYLEAKFLRIGGEGIQKDKEDRESSENLNANDQTSVSTVAEPSVISREGFESGKLGDVKVNSDSPQVDEDNSTSENNSDADSRGTGVDSENKDGAIFSEDFENPAVESDSNEPMSVNEALDQLGFAEHGETIEADPQSYEFPEVGSGQSSEDEVMWDSNPVYIPELDDGGIHHSRQ